MPVPDFIQAKFPQFAVRLDGDGPIGVAVSGGGDSVALLYALAAWKKRPLEVFCVDHGLNPLSVQWTQSVADHAARLGAGFTALHWRGEKPATGLSAAARQARHGLLAEAARRKGLSVLCLAHTADDIAEAEAMRAQGSNVGTPRVWSPSPVWPEGRDVFLYRPFLDMRRQALRDYLRHIGAGWIDDPANDSPHSLRARARKDLRDQPVAASASEADETITPALMRDLFHTPETLGPLGMIAFNADIFESLPREIALKLMAPAAVCAGGGDKLPRHDQLAAVVGNLPAGKALTLAGARICQQGRVIAISREAGDIGRNRSARVTLDGSDEAVWDGRFAIQSNRAGEITDSGHMRGDLAEADRAWLLTLPASLRRNQPVFIPSGQKDKCLLTNPALRQLTYNSFKARCLVGPRLWAALGWLTTESAIKRAKSDCVLMPIYGV